MKTIIQIILVLLFFDKNTEAQNLIINGDFEQCTKCPEKPGQLNLCPSWYIPNRSTPDLFKECHLIKSYFNIPLNAFGYQASKSGSTYIGLVIIDGVYKNYREYIQGELVETLINEKNYRISFYISWAAGQTHLKVKYFFPEAWVKTSFEPPYSL